MTRKIFAQCFGGMANEDATKTDVYKQCFGTAQPDMVDPDDVKTWGSGGAANSRFKQTYSPDA